MYKYFESKEQTDGDKSFEKGEFDNALTLYQRALKKLKALKSPDLSTPSEILFVEVEVAITRLALILQNKSDYSFEAFTKEASEFLEFFEVYTTKWSNLYASQSRSHSSLPVPNFLLFRHYLSQISENIYWDYSNFYEEYQSVEDLSKALHWLDTAIQFSQDISSRHDLLNSKLHILKTLYEEKSIQPDSKDASLLLSTLAENITDTLDALDVKGESRTHLEQALPWVKKAIELYPNKDHKKEKLLLSQLFYIERLYDITEDLKYLNLLRKHLPELNQFSKKENLEELLTYYMKAHGSDYEVCNRIKERISTIESDTPNKQSSSELRNRDDLTSNTSSEASTEDDKEMSEDPLNISISEIPQEEAETQIPDICPELQKAIDDILSSEQCSLNQEPGVVENTELDVLATTPPETVSSQAKDIIQTLEQKIEKVRKKPESFKSAAYILFANKLFDRIDRQTNTMPFEKALTYVIEIFANVNAKAPERKTILELTNQYFSDVISKNLTKSEYYLSIEKLLTSLVGKLSSEEAHLLSHQFTHIQQQLAKIRIQSLEVPDVDLESGCYAQKSEHFESEYQKIRKQYSKYLTDELEELLTNKRVKFISNNMIRERQQLTDKLSELKNVDFMTFDNINEARIKRSELLNELTKISQFVNRKGIGDNFTNLCQKTRQDIESKYKAFKEKLEIQRLESTLGTISEIDLRSSANIDAAKAEFYAKMEQILDIEKQAQKCQFDEIYNQCQQTKQTLSGKYQQYVAVKIDDELINIKRPFVSKADQKKMNDQILTLFTALVELDTMTISFDCVQKYVNQLYSMHILKDDPQLLSLMKRFLLAIDADKIQDQTWYDQANQYVDEQRKSLSSSSKRKVDDRSPVATSKKRRVTFFKPTDSESSTEVNNYKKLVEMFSHFCDEILLAPANDKNEGKREYARQDISFVLSLLPAAMAKIDTTNTDFRRGGVAAYDTYRTALQIDIANPIAREEINKLQKNRRNHAQLMSRWRYSQEGSRLINQNAEKLHITPQHHREEYSRLIKKLYTNLGKTIVAFKDDNKIIRQAFVEAIEDALCHQLIGRDADFTNDYCYKVAKQLLRDLEEKGYNREPYMKNLETFFSENLVDVPSTKETPTTALTL